MKNSQEKGKKEIVQYNIARATATVGKPFYWKGVKVKETVSGAWKGAGTRWLNSNIQQCRNVFAELSNTEEAYLEEYVFSNAKEASIIA